MDRWDIEKREEWMKWVKEIPALKFKPSWVVKVIPPFAGAIARFQVFKGDAHVSVYLDCYDKLGSMGMKPYWEIYPDKDDSNIRFYIKKTDALLKAIDESLNKQIKDRKCHKSS